MPPPEPPPPVECPPGDRGRAAMEWLEYNGLVASTPSLHASDYGKALSDPFLYYLVRRLGLVQPLSWSKALSRGSWLHARAEEFWLQTPGTEMSPESIARLNARLGARLRELREICDARHISGDRLSDILARERQDHSCALAWFEAALDVPISPAAGTLRSYLQKPHWRFIAAELPLSYTHPLFPKSPICGRLDALLYHQTQNSLWIIDFKSCSESPLVRLASCPIEQATWQYMDLVRQCILENPTALAQLNLPSDCTLGGVIHCAIRKPTIDLGSLDRDHDLDVTLLKSGPRKGLPRNEKVYRGEPSLHNYLARCRRWYLGSGEYSHKAADRQEDPPVNYSLTFSRILDEGTLSAYTDRLRLIYRFATETPWPSNFPMNPYLSREGRLSGYAPFYLTPPSLWPEIVRRDGWMVAHRDEQALASTLHTDTPIDPGATHAP